MNKSKKNQEEAYESKKEEFYRILVENAMDALKKRTEKTTQKKKHN